MRRLGRRGVLFVLVVVACAGAGAAFALLAGGSPPPPPAVPAPAAHGPAIPAEAQETVAAPANPQATAARTHALLAAPDVRGRRILFLDLDRGHVADYGRLMEAPVAAPARRRFVGEARCVRVYAATGHGVCLARTGDFGTLYGARILDSRFRTLKTIPLSGIPSRTRVSPDGRYGASTTFVSGDSYATPGKFSTRTEIYDLAARRPVANLEQFRIMRGGKRIDAPDFNFWGVTFARSGDGFYATLATHHRTYLIHGDLSTRTAHVLHENVECPSLSPDGTRIAYKKLVATAPGSPKVWHLYVLDLKTMHETSLAESTPIDDQVEWLGDHLVLYQLGEQVWVVPADGTGVPQELLPAASSPAVQP